MGAKNWMLVGSNGSARELLAKLPELDRAASLALAQNMFPGEQLTEQADGDLCCVCPPADELLVGCFGDVAVIAAKEFALERPSQLPAAFLQAMPYSTVVLHAMHSVVDFFAFGVWQGGRLERALSLSSDHGVTENIGHPLPFEQPFWAGDRRDGHEFLPIPFHPLELGDSALGALFGYVVEGEPDEGLFSPEQLPLMTLRRHQHESQKGRLKEEASSVPALLRRLWRGALLSK